MISMMSWVNLGGPFEQAAAASSRTAGASTMTTLRDRFASLVSRRPSKDAQLQERLQVPVTHSSGSAFHVQSMLKCYYCHIRQMIRGGAGCLKILRWLLQDLMVALGLIHTSVVCDLPMTSHAVILTGMTSYSSHIEACKRQGWVLTPVAKHACHRSLKPCNLQLRLWMQYGSLTVSFAGMPGSRGCSGRGSRGTCIPDGAA